MVLIFILLFAGNKTITAFFRAVMYIVAVDPAEDKPRSLTKYITFDVLVVVEKYPLLVSDNKYEQPDIAPQDNVVLL